MSIWKKLTRGVCLSVVLLGFLGCTNVIQERGPALRAPENKAISQDATKKTDFVGYEGPLGKAISFLYEPVDDTPHAVILYFGRAWLNEDMSSYNPPEQVIAPFPQTSVCYNTGDFERAQQDKAMLGVSPGFPNCKVRAGRFIFDCTYWGYTLLSVSKAEIGVVNAVSSLINDPRVNASLAKMPDNFSVPHALTPAVCRAVSVRLADWGKNMDYFLLENSDLKGACPVIEATHNRFGDHMKMLSDPDVVPTQPPYENFGMTWSVIQQGTNNWAIPLALISPESPWAQNATFGKINKEFVSFYVRTGLLYPTTTFQEVDVSETANFSINIYSLNLPNLKLLHPNSAQFDSENKWDPKWNDLIMRPGEPLNPRHWVHNLTDQMLEECADIFSKTKFKDSDVRRPEPAPSKSPGEAPKASGSPNPKGSPTPKPSGSPAFEEIPKKDLAGD